MHVQNSKLVSQVLSIMKDNLILAILKKPLDGRFLKVRLIGSINKCNVIKPRYPFKKTGMEKFEKRYLPFKRLCIIIVSTPKRDITLEKARD